MAWVLDTYITLAGQLTGRAVTGQSVVVGGASRGRSSTGAGAVEVLRLSVERSSWQKPVRVVISGFGAVGGTMAELLASDDAFCVVGVGDVSGGRYVATGIDVPRITAAVDEGGEVAEVPEGDCVSPQELLEAPCDVLVPAALAGVIDDTNGQRIQARIVLEAANGPTTPRGDAVLAERGKTVVPDLLANAGGVIASWLEWAQVPGEVPGTRDPVTPVVRQRLRRAFEETVGWASDRDVSLREAAVSIGVGRVADAHRARGLYP